MPLSLVGTGGTIASARSAAGVVAKLPVADLLVAATQAAPRLARLEVHTRDLTTRPSFAAPLGEVGELCLAALSGLEDGPEAVVMTHGTDSLEETVFLLDLLHGGDQPVVVTGAQRPHDDPERDGPANLADSLTVAASPAARAQGAMVVFGGRAWPAVGVRKRHTLEADAFSAPGGPVLRVDGADVVAVPTPSGTPRHRGFLPGAAGAVRERGLPEVAVVAGVPGGDGAAVGAAVARRPAGLVFQALGLGNASPADTEALARAVEQGVPVLVTSRVQQGPVRPVYGGGGGFDLDRAGALLVGETTTWQARVLLAVAAATRPDDPLSLVVSWLERGPGADRTPPTGRSST